MANSDKFLCYICLFCFCHLLSGASPQTSDYICPTGFTQRWPSKLCVEECRCQNNRCELCCKKVGQNCEAVAPKRDWSSRAIRQSAQNAVRQIASSFKDATSSKMNIINQFVGMDATVPFLFFSYEVVCLACAFVAGAASFSFVSTMFGVLILENATFVAIGRFLLPYAHHEAAGVAFIAATLGTVFLNRKLKDFLLTKFFTTPKSNPIALQLFIKNVPHNIDAAEIGRAVNKQKKIEAVVALFPGGQVAVLEFRNLAERKLALKENDGVLHVKNFFLRLSEQPPSAIEDNDEPNKKTKSK